jgi:hypothetical protein
MVAEAQDLQVTPQAATPTMSTRDVSGVPHGAPLPGHEQALPSVPRSGAVASARLAALHGPRSGKSVDAAVGEQDNASRMPGDGASAFRDVATELGLLAAC